MKKIKDKKQKKNTIKKETDEIFDVEKEGKEKIIKAHSKYEEVEEGKNQAKKENKILKSIFIIFGAIVVVFFTTWFIMGSIRTFDYNGVEFTKVKEGNLIFYKTFFPIKYNGKEAVYNIYIRNDPRILENVPFEGVMKLKEYMVLNSTTKNLFCGGDWDIAIANFKKINIFGINMLQNDSLSCDKGNRYTFLRIMEGNETKIVQTGETCYDLIVSNCEILKATERFMVETFVQINKEYDI